MTLSAIVGVPLGLVSGYSGGWIDNLIGRVMDVFFSFPALLLAIGVAAMLGPSLNNAIIAIAIVYAPLFGRVVRGPVLVERGREYVEAARVLGASSPRIVLLHVFPNVLSPLTVQSTITFSHAILLEAYLSSHIPRDGSLDEHLSRPSDHARGPRLQPARGRHPRCPRPSSAEPLRRRIVRVRQRGQAPRSWLLVEPGGDQALEEGRRMRIIPLDILLHHVDQVA